VKIRKGACGAQNLLVLLSKKR